MELNLKFKKETSSDSMDGYIRSCPSRRRLTTQFLIRKVRTWKTMETRLRTRLVYSLIHGAMVVQSLRVLSCLRRVQRLLRREAPLSFERNITESLMNCLN